MFGGIHDITWELDDIYTFDIVNKTWTLISADSINDKKKPHHQVRFDTDSIPNLDENGIKNSSIVYNRANTVNLPANFKIEEEENNGTGSPNKILAEQKIK